MIDLNRPVHNKDEVKYHALAHSLCRHMLDYPGSLLTVYQLAAVNPTGLMNATAAHKIDGKNVLKND